MGNRGSAVRRNPWSASETAWNAWNLTIGWRLHRMVRQLRLEFFDHVFRCKRFGGPNGGEARLDVGVDQVLSSPRMDSLITHSEISSD